ncbi:MAG: alkene reductase, partial [Betaproteobacteria bacterium]
MTTLFDPIRIGDIELQTRLAMAPLTRSRAKGTVPNDLMRQYYEQRANPHTGAGLIITEAAQISPEGQGYLD